MKCLTSVRLKRDFFSLVHLTPPAEVTCFDFTLLNVRENSLTHTVIRWADGVDSPLAPSAIPVNEKPSRERGRGSERENAGNIEILIYDETGRMICALIVLQPNTRRIVYEKKGADNR